MPNTIKGASAPQSASSASADVQNCFDVAIEQTRAALAIIDAVRVLCALERSPEHHDTHPDHNIKTGGGFAHGLRLYNDTLPTMLSHAHGLVDMSLNDFDVMRETALNAMNGGAA